MNILLSFMLIQIVLFFLGIGYGWSVFQYDELRLLQLLLGFLGFFYLLFNKKINLSHMSILCFFLIFLILIFNYKIFNIYNKQDLVLFISSFFILLSLKYLFQENNFNDKYIYILVISAIIPALFIFLSIFNLFDQRHWFDWQLNSGSVRIYDSALVPIYYFVLYLGSTNNRFNNSFFSLFIIMIGLALFFDGARSALLSCILPLVMVFIFSNKHRMLVIKIIGYMLFSFAVYYGTFWFFSLVNEREIWLSIEKYSSSSRFDIWYLVFLEWLKTPFIGIGGGGLAEFQSVVPNHLHNFYLKLIFEWGVIGVVLFIWIIYKNFKFIFGANDWILKAGILGIAIDALFSGNLIYPGSLLTCLMYLAFAFSKENSSICIEVFSQKKSKFLVLLFGALFGYILFTEFHKDLICWGCGSYDSVEAPGFWYYGAAKQLIPADQIP